MLNLLLKKTTTLNEIRESYFDTRLAVNIVIQLTLYYIVGNTLNSVSQHVDAAHVFLTDSKRHHAKVLYRDD